MKLRYLISAVVCAICITDGMAQQLPVKRHTNIAFGINRRARKTARKVYRTF